MSVYTESARGQNCTVRIPGVCNHNSETVVFAHLNGGGMGMKHADIHGCYACFECHQWLDGGYADAGKNKIGMTKRYRDEVHLKAMLETQQIMIRNGVLVL